VNLDAAIATIKRLGFDAHGLPDGQLTVAAIRAVTRQALDCLATISRAANGDVPSAVVGHRPNPAALSDAAYWVALLISGGLIALSRLQRRQPTSELVEALVEATTTLSYAWAQVLAGDIDDICEGLKEALE
jgi:hypothetical protein